MESLGQSALLVEWTAESSTGNLEKLEPGFAGITSQVTLGPVSLEILHFETD